jgi:hypothetical protein
VTIARAVEQVAKERLAGGSCAAWLIHAVQVEMASCEAGTEDRIHSLGFANWTRSKYPAHSR